MNETHKTFGYELVKGVVTALLGTSIVTTFDIYDRPSWVISTYTMVHMFSYLRLTQEAPRVARAL